MNKEVEAEPNDDEPTIKGWSKYEALHPAVKLSGKQSLMNRSKRGHFPTYIRLTARQEPLWRDHEVKMWMRKNLPAAVLDDINAELARQYGIEGVPN